MTVGAPASDWLLPSAFFLFLLLMLPPWAAMLTLGLAPFPTYRAGGVC
jgi:hypothetical protein